MFRAPVHLVLLNTAGLCEEMHLVVSIPSPTLRFYQAVMPVVFGGFSQFPPTRPQWSSASRAATARLRPDRCPELCSQGRAFAPVCAQVGEQHRNKTKGPTPWEINCTGPSTNPGN